MSQQTRIQTLIPYYQRWMETFPTVCSLAAAQEDDVRRLWAGLGYYRRAALLHKGALHVMKEHQGVLPRTAKELQAIPGIGPYTAAAVASLCFGEPVAAVDGNVMRVLARVQGVRSFNPKVPADIKRARDQWGFELFADMNADQESGKDQASSNAMKKKPVGSDDDALRRLPGQVNEGLMELGATLCRPNGAPLCESCPLQTMCAAYHMQQRGDIEEIDGVIPCRGEKTKVSVQHMMTVIPYCRTGPPSSDAKKGGAVQTSKNQKKDLESRIEVGLVQTPVGSSSSSSLLAGMYQFPMVPQSLVVGQQLQPSSSCSASPLPTTKPSRKRPRSEDETHDEEEGRSVVAGEDGGDGKEQEAARSLCLSVLQAALLRDLPTSGSSIAPLPKKAAATTMTKSVHSLLPLPVIRHQFSHITMFLHPIAVEFRTAAELRAALRLIGSNSCEEECAAPADGGKTVLVTRGDRLGGVAVSKLGTKALELLCKHLDN